MATSRQWRVLLARLLSCSQDRTAAYLRHADPLVQHSISNHTSTGVQQLVPAGPSFLGRRHASLATTSHGDKPEDGTDSGQSNSAAGGGRGRQGLDLLYRSPTEQVWPASTLQARYASRVHRALATALLEHQFRSSLIDDCGLTVMEVRMAPDLMTAYILWTAHETHMAVAERELRRCTARLRQSVARHLQARRVPRLEWRRDAPTDHQAAVEAAFRALDLQRARDQQEQEQEQQQEQEQLAQTPQEVEELSEEERRQVAQWEADLQLDQRDLLQGLPQPGDTPKVQGWATASLGAPPAQHAGRHAPAGRVPTASSAGARQGQQGAGAAAAQRGRDSGDEAEEADSGARAEVGAAAGRDAALEAMLQEAMRDPDLQLPGRSRPGAGASSRGKPGRRHKGKK